jgi:hypothetical protein
MSSGSVVQRAENIDYGASCEKEFVFLTMSFEGTTKYLTNLFDII